MPIKNPEKRRAYLKKWRAKNPEKVKEDYQKHKEERDEKSNEYRKDNPWIAFYTNARQRCTNPKCPAYKWYGAKGIKFLLSIEEIKKLWFKDKAYNLKNPSIDRRESDLDYTYNNCRFIERWVNVLRKVDSE